VLLLVLLLRIRRHVLRLVLLQLGVLLMVMLHGMVRIARAREASLLVIHLR